MMFNPKVRKKDRQNGQAVVVEKDKMLLISSKLMADLKNKGILAFREMTDDQQRLVWKWCKEVIRQYRGVLEADPRNIRNVNSLPFPKEDIQLAIKLSLPFYITKNMQSMVKTLKNAYREIGTFQSIDPEDEKYVASVATTKVKKTSEQAQNALRSYEKYMDLAVSEKKILLQEINNFVTELEALR
jgi:hypothetical protein